MELTHPGAKAQNVRAKAQNVRAKAVAIRYQWLLTIPVHIHGCAGVDTNR